MTKDEYLNHAFGNSGVGEINNVMDIGCLTDTEQVTVPYVDGLKNAKSWDDVEKVINRWSFLVQDAKHAMEEFKSVYDWNSINERIRNDSSPDMEKIVKDIGPIFMPEVLMQTFALANYYGTPWGAAFIQSVAADALEIVDGIVHLKKKLVEKESG